MLFGLGVAIPAKYWSIAARLKWDFCLGVALTAGDGIHLARASINVTAAFISKTLGFSNRTTR